jgi:hypothetical protein
MSHGVTRDNNDDIGTGIASQGADRTARKRQLVRRPRIKWGGDCHATTRVTQKDTSYPQERRSAYATRSYGPSRHHHQNAIVSQTS